MRRVCSRRRGPIFYRPNLALLYVEYDGICQHYRGWPLTEVKNMCHRERHYWVALIRWRMNSLNYMDINGSS